MQRIIEMFEDENKKLSLPRVLLFLSFFPSTYIAVVTKGPDIYSWYVGVFAVQYMGGKGINLIQAIKGNNNGTNITDTKPNKE